MGVGERRGTKADWASHIANFSYSERNILFCQVSFENANSFKSRIKFFSDEIFMEKEL